MSAAPTNAAKGSRAPPRAGASDRRAPRQRADADAHAASARAPPSAGRALSRRPSLRGRSARMRPSIHDEDAVAERKDFAELGRNQQNGATGVALGDKLAMDEFGGADVDAARRLFGDQRRRFMRNSRATTIFCRLPPESEPDRARSLAILMPNRAMSARAGSRRPRGSMRPRGRAGPCDESPSQDCRRRSPRAPSRR